MGWEERFDDLIIRIYDGVLDPDAWPAVLGDLTTLFDAATGAIVLRDEHRTCRGFAAVVGIDAYWAKAYQEYFSRIDVISEQLVRAGCGTAHLSQGLVPDADLIGTEFYQDYLRPRGIFYSLGTAIGLKGGGAVIGLGRSHNRGPFDEEHRRRFARLVPHLQRALVLGETLGCQAKDLRAALDALDRLAHGVFLLDEEGRVTYANPVASAIAAREDGLAIKGSRLCATSRRDQAQFDRLLGRTAANRPDEAGGGMLLSRLSSPRPLTVLAVPARRCLGGSADLGRRKPRLAVFVADTACQHEALAQQLGEIYRLTPMEARTAEAIASGLTIDEAAGDLGVGRETVRFHLKNVFRKTNTRGQTDLVRLVAKGPASLVWQRADPFVQVAAPDLKT